MEKKELFKDFILGIISLILLIIAWFALPICAMGFSVIISEFLWEWFPVLCGNCNWIIQIVGIIGSGIGAAICARPVWCMSSESADSRKKRQLIVSVIYFVILVSSLFVWIPEVF